MRERDKEIEQGRGRVAWCKAKLKELEFHEQTLPRVGYGRAEWKRTKAEIEELKEFIFGEEEWIKYAEELEIVLDRQEKEMEAKYGSYKMSPEEERDFEVFMADVERRQAEREKMNAEAEKRRDQFRLISGGKDE
jgi:hypothetical protein